MSSNWKDLYMSNSFFTRMGRKPREVFTPFLAKQRRAVVRAMSLAPLLPVGTLLSACGGGGSSDATPVAATTGTTSSNAPSVSTAASAPSVPSASTRTWQMGFAGDPPRPNVDSLMEGIGQWSQRAEFAVMHQDLPWDDLLAGVPADTLVARDKQSLADYYRAKGLQIVFIVDPNNGLSRAEDAARLVALGRSFVEAPVQQLYRDYVVAVAKLLKPDVIGLVPESNLIRAAAPPALYAAIKQAANAAAADARAAGSTATLMNSVQVETAWGKIAGNGSFAGIAQDLADFPFVQVLGLSSYPYFVFNGPEDLPVDYYSRVVAGSGLRAMVVEGGWTSVTSGSTTSSPDVQAKYIARHSELLDSISALGVAQLVYADPDLSSLPQPLPANLSLFAHIGLTDSDFNAKPALAAWDTLFARPKVT